MISTLQGCWRDNSTLRGLGKIHAGQDWNMWSRPVDQVHHMRNAAYWIRFYECAAPKELLEKVVRQRWDMSRKDFETSKE